MQNIPYIQIVTNDKLGKHSSLLYGCYTAYQELTMMKNSEQIIINFFNKQGEIYLTLPYQEALVEIRKYI